MNDLAKVLKLFRQSFMDYSVFYLKLFLDVFDVLAADGDRRGLRLGGAGHHLHGQVQQEGDQVREEEDESRDRSTPS